MPRRKLSTAKKIVFSAVLTLMFFGMLELVLAALGWTPSSTTEDPYVGFAGHSPLMTRSFDDLGQPEYMTARNKLRWFNRQTFPVTKPADTLRIFSLGGSTTYGHPYDDQTSFSGWLREFLPLADSSKKYEVINCGGISYASYRVANLMEELLEYEPDLFIIYTGHNEFLEARTYEQLRKTPSLVLQLGSLASRTRTFTAMQRLASGSLQSQATPKQAQSPATDGQQSGQLSSEVHTLLDSAVGPSVYHRDDKQRAQIFAHFEFNLRRMVQMARSRGAKVILVTPASNIGQCSPFKSEHSPGLLGAKLLEWTGAYDKAQEMFAAGQHAEAMYPINLAVQLNDRHADTLYLRGRILQALGEGRRAQRDYLKARDEDVCTLRAPQDIIDAVRRVASESSVPVVDFVKWTEDHSPDGITGDSLFLDHVHGTIDAYKQLSLLLLSTMYQIGLIAQNENNRGADPLSSELVSQATQRVMSHIDSARHGVALRNISKVYSWAGKKEDADRVALRALELVPNDADTVYQAANAHVRLGQIDEAIRLYERVMELRPDFAASVHASLGFAYAAKAQEDKAVEHYQQALKLNPQFADIHHNLAAILEKRNQLPEAASHYRQAIANNPHHYQAQYRLGLVLALQQDWEPARKQFLEAARLNPSAIEPHLALGQVLAILGDKQAAMAEYKWVLDRSPGNVQADTEIKKLIER